MDETSSTSSEIDRLLKLAAAGDDNAFAQLFERFKAHLRQYIELRMDAALRQRVDASDILQETQIEFHKRIQDYVNRNPMPLRVWLRKTAEQRLLLFRQKHIGAAKRSVDRERPLPDFSSQMIAQRLIDPGPTPSEHLISREFREHAIAVITNMPTIDQEILLMRVVEGLNYEEISASLDISKAAAKKRLTRAVIRLQQQINL